MRQPHAQNAEEGDEEVAVLVRLLERAGGGAVANGAILAEIVCEGADGGDRLVRRLTNAALERGVLNVGAALRAEEDWAVGGVAEVVGKGASVGLREGGNEALLSSASAKLILLLLLLSRGGALRFLLRRIGLCLCLKGSANDRVHKRRDGRVLVERVGKGASDANERRGAHRRGRRASSTGWLLLWFVALLIVVAVTVGSGLSTSGATTGGGHELGVLAALRTALCLCLQTRRVRELPEPAEHCFDAALGVQVVGAHEQKKGARDETELLGALHPVGFDRIVAKHVEGEDSGVVEQHRLNVAAALGDPPAMGNVLNEGLFEDVGILLEVGIRGVGARDTRRVPLWERKRDKVSRGGGRGD